MTKKQKSYNELIKAGIGLGATNIGLGLTSSVVEKVGGDAAPLVTLGKVMKPVATITGASVTMDMLQNLNKKTNRRR